MKEESAKDMYELNGQVSYVKNIYIFHSIIDIGCSFESDYLPIKIILMRAHGAILTINLNFLLDTLLFGVLLFITFHVYTVYLTRI